MDILNGLYNADMKKFADPYQNGVERFDKLSECVQKVIKGLGDNTSSALDIAKSLYNIKTFEMYKGYPVAGSNGCTVYSTFEQFCSDFFKAKKSTIYNYLSIYEKFGSDSELRPKAIPSNFAKNYTYSQLLLMSSLSDTELLKVQPDWTCKKIKEYVKENSILNSKRLEKSSENKKISLVDLFNEIKMIFVSVSHMEMDSSSKEMFYRGYLTALSSLLSKLNLDLDDEMRRIYRGVISNE